MAILGAYEDHGEVIVEFSDHPPTRLHWRTALQRCEGIARAEQSVGIGRREAGVQKVIEQIIAAARDARKKDPAQTGWKPPTSVSMYKSASRAEISAARIKSQRKIILPT